MRKVAKNETQLRIRVARLGVDFLRKFGRQGLGFAIAGLAGVASDLATFNLLLHYGVGLTLASVVAASVGLGINFLINLITFSRITLPPRTLIVVLAKYSIVAGLSTVYILVVFEIVLAVFELQSPVLLNGARLSIIVTGTLVRFFLYRLWVFRASKRDEASGASREI